MNTPSSTVTPSLAYLAGYFDGEGTICFVNQKSPQLKVRVRSGDKSCLDLFQAAFGKSVRPIRVTSRANRQIYEWEARNGDAQEVLRQLLPWLCEKRSIALLVLALKFNERGEARRVSEEELTNRRYISLLVSQFNNRQTVLPEYRA